MPQAVPVHLSADHARALVGRAHHAVRRGPFPAVLGLALVLAGAQVIGSPTAAADPAPGHLVINEISGGNGTGTAATDEYVELYNPTDATITFTGTIQYKSATGTSYAASGPVTTFVVAPHGYWLVAGVNYSGAAVPDSRYTFDMSASTTGGGHIALTGATSAGTSPTNDPLRVDLIGWGTANAPETAAAPSHPAVGGSLRRTNGIDTDDNSVDFIPVASRSPRSSTSTATTVTDPGAQVYPVNQPISPVTVTAAGGRAPYSYAISSGSLPAGLTLGSSTGQISGTPTSARPAEDVTVRATDANGDPAYSTFSISVVDGSATPVTVASPGSKTFTVGTPIAPFTVAASGGVAPYTYAVTAGALPAGIVLDGDSGEIAGAPTAAAAAADVTVTATDADGNTGSATFSVSVGPGALTAAVPTIDDTTPVVGDTLTATAGTWGPAPVALAYQWLADGAEIDGADGSTLAVTAGLVGAVLSVRVSGTKAEYLAASRVSAATSAVVAPVTVTSPGSQAFIVGAPIAPFALVASGGVAPYTFGVTAGALPAGVTLDASTGRVSGTPTAAAAAANVTITATDARGDAGSTAFSVTVDAAPGTGAPGAGDPLPAPVTPAPVSPVPVTPAPVIPAPVRPDVDVRMKPVDRRPEHRVRMRILVAGAAVTGTLRIQVGDRKVRTRAVDGVVRLTPAQITKLVVKPKAPGTTRPKPPTTGAPTPEAKPRPKYRQVRAIVHYRGNPDAPVSAPFTIRVKRLHP